MTTATPRQHTERPQEIAARLAAHLEGLRQALEETGRPAEAAAIRTELEMLDALRRALS